MRLRLDRRFAPNLVRVLVFAQCDELRMAQVIRRRPFRKLDRSY
jgi:hypothetical protein